MTSLGHRGPVARVCNYLQKIWSRRRKRYTIINDGGLNGTHSKDEEVYKTVSQRCTGPRVSGGVRGRHTRFHLYYRVKWGSRYSVMANETIYKFISDGDLKRKPLKKTVDVQLDKKR